MPALWISIGTSISSARRRRGWSTRSRGPGSMRRSSRVRHGMAARCSRIRRWCTDGRRPTSAVKTRPGCSEPDRDPGDRSRISVPYFREGLDGSVGRAPRGTRRPAGDGVPQRCAAAEAVLGAPPGARDHDPHGRCAERRGRLECRSAADAGIDSTSPSTASTNCCAASSRAAGRSCSTGTEFDVARCPDRFRPAMDGAHRRADDRGR